MMDRLGTAYMRACRVRRYYITPVALFRRNRPPVFLHPRNWPRKIWDCYDEHHDIFLSVQEGFRAINARKRAGGPGWTSPPRK